MQIEDVLAQPGGGEALQLEPIPGGGSSSISVLAASIRNFGFEVRAGGPRRSQASSLRSRFFRRVSMSTACRARSARASTYAA